MGRPGLGAPPRPTARPWGVRPGPTAHWLCVWGVQAWGPATYPTARALASWVCALWGRQEGAQGGGGRLLPECGASWVGRFPTSYRPSWGRAAGAHCPLAMGAGDAGVGTRHQRHSARSCVLALRAVGAARGRLGGGRLLPVCVASGVGRPPTPDRLSLGHAAGAHYPLAVGAGDAAGVWSRHQPHSARSCELALRAVGAARRRLVGAPLACVWGVRGWALSHARSPVLGACGRGPLKQAQAQGIIMISWNLNVHNME